MVKYTQSVSSEEQIDLIFHSLSDPTRRGILQRLAVSELTVTEIAKPYEMSLPAISKHLKILEQARLVGRSKHGREHQIHLEAKGLQKGADYIAFYKKFWNTRLGNLEKFLRKK